jgi:hypothetical protein
MKPIHSSFLSYFFDVGEKYRIRLTPWHDELRENGVVYVRKKKDPTVQ